MALHTSLGRSFEKLPGTVGAANKRQVWSKIARRTKYLARNLVLKTDLFSWKSVTIYFYVATSYLYCDTSHFHLSGTGCYFYLLIWLIMSLSTLYRSYHDG